jgi:acyl-CoA thioesterase-2
VADLWSDLLACLDLGPPPAVDEHRSVLAGANLPLNHHWLFGGQLLAQIVRAAELVCPDKSVKSLQVLFAAAGVDTEPVRYEITRQGDGRAFATLAVTARQDAGTIASAVVSMHAPEDGWDRQDVPAAPPLPGPEHGRDLHLMPWEVRLATDLDSPDPQAPALELWMRTPSAPPQSARPLLAYATDLTLIGTALLRLGGIGQEDSGRLYTSAVTSHSVWFHRPFRTDEWLLLRQESPIATGGRCFGRGDVLGADGVLVASYAQEALLRFGS